MRESAEEEQRQWMEGRDHLYKRPTLRQAWQLWLVLPSGQCCGPAPLGSPPGEAAPIPHLANPSTIFSCG